MTKIAQFWDLIESSSFCEDIKDIKENDDDYNNKEDNNKQDIYDKDNKDYKYEKDISALGLIRDVYFSRGHQGK